MERSIYKVEMKDGVAVMTIALDSITWHENEELKKAFTSLIDEGNKKIVLDLSSIAFISSLVLASLVYMLKRAKEAGGNLVLCGLQEKVKEVIAMTSLDKVFDIFDDCQKAVSSFGKSK